MHRLRRTLLDKASPSCRYLVVECAFQCGSPGCAQFSDRCGDKLLAVHRNLQPIAGGGADARSEEAVLVGEFFDGGNLAWIGGEDDGGCRLREEPEQRMHHQSLFLLDRGADAVTKRGLRERNRNAAVGEVSG